jgi:alpha-glucosidase
MKNHNIKVLTMSYAMYRNMIIALLFTAASIGGCRSTTGKICTEGWTLTSPGGNVEVIILPASQKSLAYTVRLSGRTVIGKSPLGVTLKGVGGDFVSDLSIIGERRGSHQEVYEMISGKKSNHFDNYNELILSFTNGARSPMELEIRAYDDGMGYSYRFPGEGERTVLSESSGFQVPLRSNMWAARYGYDYEQMYERGVVGTDFVTGQLGSGDIEIFEKYGRNDELAFPVLYKTPEGDWALLSEAGIYDQYCGSHLGGKRRNEGLFEIVFFQHGTVTSPLPLETPWRAVIVGETLSPIVASVLIDNLNPPNELGSLEWIRPGKSINTWMTAAPQEAVPEFIAMGKELGWEFNGSKDGLGSSGVDMRTYLGLSYDDTMAKVREIVEQAAKNKAVTFFCDYVNGDSQQHMRFCDAVVRLCAEHKMTVVFHGATIPRGQRRRFPNIIGVEAVRGEEYFKQFSSYPPTPADFCTLPFTRNVIGPMDVTGVVFDGPLARPMRKLTNAAELATALLFETGIQTGAPLPHTPENTSQ